MKKMMVTKLMAGILISTLLIGCNTKELNNESQSTDKIVENKEVIAQTNVSNQAQEISTVAQTLDSNPLKITYNVYTEIIRDFDGDDEAILELNITWPVIDNPNNDSAIARINEYYGIEFDHFISTVISEGAEYARNDKEAAISGGYEFYPHVYDRRVSVNYNGNGLLSVLNMDYESTGGAHPNSFWHSQTFDVKTGEKLTLADVLGLSKEKAAEKVYEAVLLEIEKNKGSDEMMYNESYKEDIKLNYSEEDFVLTESGIVFYYQLYAIAPYAAGIPAFELPLDTKGAITSGLPRLQSKELENGLYYAAAMLIEANKVNYYEIFGLSMLSMDIPENRADEEVLFPVVDERFSVYADFEAYVRGTYVKKEADTLLNNGRYHNIDGKLYGDLSMDAGGGYYINWDEYRYEVTHMTDKKAVLNVFLTEESFESTKDITLTVNMHNENGNWLLEKMFY